MTDLGPPVATTGRHLLTGPSNAGKTRQTAATLADWLDRVDSDGVVVLDFAPELERDGRLLGGRLDRFLEVPDDCWYGVLDAHAPRADAADDAGATALARSNAERAQRLLDAVPEPRAAFVNDATIPAQATGDPSPVLAACADAELVVCNAFDSDELGDDDPVSRNERAALAAFDEWADERHRL